MSDDQNAEKGPDALIEQRGHTLILTLNRPEARNALSTEMLSIMVEAWDRVGLLRDISTVVADEKVNIASLRIDEQKADRTVVVSITLETTGVDQLSRLFSKIESVHGVFAVAREADVPASRDVV